MPENPTGGTNISGGNVVAGNIGGSGNQGAVTGPVNFTVGAESDALAATLADLRAELATLRAALPAVDGPHAHPDEVTELIGELEQPEPDLPQVTSKWRRLWHRIPESMQTLDNVERILDLVARVGELAP
ncbi:hypothetical protein JK358_00250 [Nocardia sp. 2]|uniref:Uncharacterized protein n=1 Tax=Nocardia acididurans TaxID=2802282 RepID=A0ABS1LZ67_9NOCA|nr:hypothetical protein [Nocardia acididurans]MBL1072819.1 hypothetical protein [Nocardia acididurans]